MEALSKPEFVLLLLSNYSSSVCGRGERSPGRSQNLESLTRSLGANMLLFKMQTTLKSFYLSLTLIGTLVTRQARNILLNLPEIRDLRTLDRFSGCLLGKFTRVS